MATENCTLDIRKDGNYNIIFQVNRTLNQEFEATFYSGTTEYPFDFTEYTGASLSVRTKPDFPNAVLEFDTTDGSIILGNNGIFALVKTDEEMNVRHGDYVYDMYLRKDDTKREFLRGNFKLTNDVTK